MGWTARGDDGLKRSVLGMRAPDRRAHELEFDGGCRLAPIATNGVEASSASCTHSSLPGSRSRSGGFQGARIENKDTIPVAKVRVLPNRFEMAASVSPSVASPVTFSASSGWS